MRILTVRVGDEIIAQIKDLTSDGATQSEVTRRALAVGLAKLLRKRDQAKQRRRRG